MRILALDIGTKRVGVAFADTSVRIAIPRGMIPVDGNEFAGIAKQFRLEKADLIVAGQPRNSKGETTAQTEWVYSFIISLKDYFVKHNQKEPLVKFQDESLTSVQAENLLGGKRHEVSRQDRADGKVDAEAAAIILQDFLEAANFAQLENELKGE
jgi:putative Holliday junction resolvase